MAENDDIFNPKHPEGEMTFRQGLRAFGIEGADKTFRAMTTCKEWMAQVAKACRDCLENTENFPEGYDGYEDIEAIIKWARELEFMVNYITPGIDGMINASNKLRLKLMNVEEGNNGKN